MTQSMTAFARVQKELDTGIFCWEIRSVNHRYLDATFRIPDAFRFLETALRAMLRGKISRGKLECQLKFQDVGSHDQAILINENLVNGLITAGNKLSATHHLANDLSLTALLTWPGVAQTTQPDIEMLGQYAEQLFDEALTRLLKMREIEGQALQTYVLGRLENLSVVVNNAMLHVAANTQQARDKLLNRLKTLQMDVDNVRIEQEIALLLTRLDVSEELDRLQMHIKEVANVLKNTEAAGRRLDFLMQELNREANTLSSKSDSMVLTQCAVEMKVLIEQMREQIQNIE